MTNFTYELPPEQNPTASLGGLSPEALVSLSDMAMGPSSADKLLGKAAGIGTKSERAELIDGARQELYAFAKQIYDDPKTQELFTRSFVVAWDDEKEEPAIWHIDSETKQRDEHYNCGISASQASGRLLLPRHLRIETLTCVDTNFTELPELPDGLRTLYLMDGKLTALPELPSSLELLVCPSNQLTALPDLPAGLNKLHCGDNPLEILPILPEGLKELRCDVAQPSELPPLPRGLTMLDCSYNELGTLPALPLTLRELYCDGTGLRSFAKVLPDLKYLTATDNNITELPELPGSLRVCRMAGNPLSRKAKKAVSEVGLMRRRLG